MNGAAVRHGAEVEEAPMKIEAKVRERISVEADTIDSGGAAGMRMSGPDLFGVRGLFAETPAEFVHHE